ncbi:MAG TPA: type IV pilus secretin PilQ [Pyrinomonadaceae bacterium]|nr:type IV pilus secretin PilQ [Pyrinomonadaceae bacterium]
MFNQHHPISAIIKRGTLVLSLLCSFTIFAQAAVPAALLTGVRTAVEGEATRITFAGTAPMAYGVRRVDERTLLVELPGVDASRLAHSYSSASPLVAGLTVQCVTKEDGAPVARLRVALRKDVRDRSFLEANEVVLELRPDQTQTGAQTTATREAHAVAATTEQQTPASRPSPTPNISAAVRSATAASAGPQSTQGQQYGQYGFVGEPINLNVVNADIRDILNYITEQYGVNFIIDSSVAAVPVTVNVTEVPWNIALDSILRANRLGIEVSGNILRVATLKVLAEEAEAQASIDEGRLNSAPLVTEFIRLNYARAVGTLAQAAGSTGAFSGGSSNASFSGGAGGDATGKSGDQGILPIISRRLSKRGSVEVDGRSNTLIITDVRENISAIRQLVSLLDQPEPQVEIETRIVIASRDFSRDLGVQLSALRLNGNGPAASFSTVPGSPLPQNDDEGGGSSQNTTGFRPGGIPVGIGLEPTRALGANAPSTVIGLTTGIIGTVQLSALITAAESKGQAKIVANPRVTALNNRPAQIESGSQIPVVTPQAGGGTGGAVVFTTTFISVPLRLSITPQITDAGTVVLRVTAENNSVNLSLTNSLGTPGIDTQRMQTEVLVPDGGTTVVGGVLGDIEGETQTRTPGISGIPVIGNLFKRKATRRTTTELLFFITPRIYRPDYNGRPTAGTVSDRTRSATIPQPVPLGNPQSNTPPPVGSQQQNAQPTSQPGVLPETVPSARPDATRGDRPKE